MSPKADKVRTVAADDNVRRGRLAKARQFLRVAEDARDLADDEATVGDAAVTLYVHAGTAAADAICARALGKHSKGQGHQDAVALLASADSKSAQHLRVLFELKTRAGYGHDPVSTQNLTRAARAARSLVETATL